MFFLSLHQNVDSIMTQILVTLNEDVTTQAIRKAIELMRGVATTVVLKSKATDNHQAFAQQKLVKDSLTRAFDEVHSAQREGRKLQSADEFIAELQSESVQ